MAQYHNTILMFVEFIRLLWPFFGQYRLIKKGTILLVTMLFGIYNKLVKLEGHDSTSK